MKKIMKVLLIIVGVLVCAILLIVSYLKFMLPNVGDAPELTVEVTPERVQRGEYLANHVTVCMDCHSTRDWSKFAGPIGGEIGEGGERFTKEMGFPGEIYSPNITPHNLKEWTDGEIFRAITTGVNKHGKALFPVMPYASYGSMDKEDIYSIIAYLRTLKPIATETPERSLDFPVSLLVNTIPVPANPVTKPDVSDKVNYGKYLVNASGCVDCHSKVDDKGQLIAGTEFGGGREFAAPGGTLRTPNITSHETGIGSWTAELFIQKFKLYTDSSYVSPNLTPADFNTLMPWTMYAGMTNSDLEAIFLYLQSVNKINNKVEIWSKN